MNENEQAYYLTILANYSLPKVLSVETRDSGMNNTTRYAVLEDRSVRVLRIYENHQDLDKLRAEHEVLLQLQRQVLPFAVPYPVTTKSGLTWVEAEDGKLASLFPYLNGSRPSSDLHEMASEYGRVVGSLVQAMAVLEVKESPAYPPYDERLDTPREILLAVENDFETHPVLASLMEDVRYLIDRFKALQEKAEEVRGLPRQWIHGDFSYANALVEGNRVSAVLDFEFATRDIRAMELAVCLAEQLSAPGGISSSSMTDMLSGYQSVFPLEASELRLLPPLIQLRKLDVFLHFWERFTAGLDPVQVLMEQTERAAAVCRFVDEHVSSFIAD
ncbi:phosphotransferase [Gorillibacterium timonense]|uniref:phosphotransferase n=1 Tax=Gorillibacterium timonense TaxID=1689269 RepID=UPI00071C9A18|nr:phosphotransferase [Gorillibacterium timonense]